MSDLNKTQIGGDHYTNKSVQPWEAMQAWMSHEEFTGFLRGNVIKYVARCNDKGGIEDLKKARHYLDKLIDTMSCATPVDQDLTKPIKIESLKTNTGPLKINYWLTKSSDHVSDIVRSLAKDIKLHFGCDLINEEVYFDIMFDNKINIIVEHKKIGDFVDYISKLASLIGLELFNYCYGDEVHGEKVLFPKNVDCPTLLMMHFVEKKR